MSDKTHKILTGILGVLFTVLLVLAHSKYAASNTKLHDAFDLSLQLLGALGITATKPLLGGGDKQ